MFTLATSLFWPRCIFCHLCTWWQGTMLARHPKKRPHQPRNSAAQLRSRTRTRREARNWLVPKPEKQPNLCMYMEMDFPARSQLRWDQCSSRDNQHLSKSMHPYFHKIGALQKLREKLAWFQMQLWCSWLFWQLQLSLFLEPSYTEIIFTNIIIGHLILWLCEFAFKHLCS